MATTARAPSPPPAPGWLDSLDLLLSPSAQHGHALSLGELLDELNGWLKIDRSRRQWTLNRRSLGEEVEATCKLLGSKLRKAIGKALPDACKAIRDLSRIDAPALTEQHFVLDAFTALGKALASDAAVLAAWQDLLDEVQSQGPSLIKSEQLTVVLASCLELRDVDSKSCFSELRRTFGGSPAGPNRSAAYRDDSALATAETALLDNSDRILLAVPTPMHCVVWLQYEFARIHEFVHQTGDVTFFTANWALPNARQDDGQDFLFRDEMRAVLREYDDWWTDKGPDEPHSFVVARVDLGVRMTRGAIKAGDELVDLLVAVATAQSGGIRWRRTGTAFLAVDGTGFGLEMVATRSEPTTSYYGMEITSETLGTRASELAQTMTTRPLPAEIREAIRLISEAGLERSYETAFGVTQNLHARTAVAQRNHAFEHIAAWGRYSARELEHEVTQYWARSAWEHEMGTIIERAIRLSWDQPRIQDLNSTLHPGGYGQPLMFPIAHDHQKEIVALLPTAVERERLRWLMKGMRDPAHYLLIERSYQTEDTLGLDRLRRVRNALVHGNPVTPAVVKSVADIAVRRSNHALNLAVEAFNAGISLDQLLTADRNIFEGTHTSLEFGASWLDLWAAATL